MVSMTNEPAATRRLMRCTEPIFIELSVSITFDPEESEQDAHDTKVLQEESDKLEDGLRRMQAGKEAMDDIPKEVRKLLAA